MKAIALLTMTFLPGTYVAVRSRVLARNSGQANKWVLEFICDAIARLAVVTRLVSCIASLLDLLGSRYSLDCNGAALMEHLVSIVDSLAYTPLAVRRPVQTFIIARQTPSFAGKAHRL